MRALLCVLVVLLSCRGAPPAPPPVTAPVTVAAPVVPDRDGDGANDAVDRCPEEPEDCDGVDDADGCPDPDDDHDGVNDVCDACPHEAGNPPDGCVHRVILTQEDIRIIHDVFFPVNSVVMSPQSAPSLEEIGRLMQLRTDIRRVEVGGHASNDERDTLRLSQRRADAAVAFLVAHGVDASRLVARGYGVDQPVAPNSEASGRARNRRVSVRVLDIDTPPPQPPSVALPDGCPDAPPPPRHGRCSAG